MPPKVARPAPAAPPNRSNAPPGHAPPGNAPPGHGRGPGPVRQNPNAPRPQNLQRPQTPQPRQTQKDEDGADMVAVRSSAILAPRSSIASRWSNSTARKPKLRDPLDWELDQFPKIQERTVVEAKIDPAILADLRAKAHKKILESKGEDPAVMTRRWMFNLSIIGVENATKDEWHIFLASSLKSETSRLRNRLHGNFAFTKSYIVPGSQKKTFAKLEQVYSRTVDHSYQSLQRDELCIDVWMVSNDGFNHLLGTATRQFYDMANNSVKQTMLIKPNLDASNKALNIGVIHINCMLSEVKEFSVVLSNWAFQAKAELRDFTESKKLVIEFPSGPNQPPTSFSTSPARGPNYVWASAGQYNYVGTRIGLSTDAMTISVISGERGQGRAIISLSGVGEYPIALGVVKALTNNVTQYVQGRVGGSLTVTSKSLLLEPNVRDEDPSIPAPMQPVDSVVMYCLNPEIMYLVVNVQGADGLPIADVDMGSSNPFARVKFDGIVQQSEVVEGSTAPTWNRTFYLPVRVPFARIQTDPNYYKHLYPEEIRSKGFLEVEVWHFDGVPTEFLGSFRLDLNQTRFGQVQPRAIYNAVAKTRVARDGDGEPDEDDVTMGIHPALSRVHNTKVYSVRKETLSGSWLTSTNRPTISFECYFIPDFRADFRYPEQKQEGIQRSEALDQCYENWENVWREFKTAYAAWFPDAPDKRRFLHCYNDASGEVVPLPRLITPLALPASLATPLQVMHWIKCMEFFAPPRQRSVGQIATWSNPADVLSSRRGSVQDHAVLLCCALLGLKRDAFVCKGSIQGGKDHTWVMTREAHGSITFWEPTTGAKYHLASRWLGDPIHSPATKAKAEERWKARQVNWKWKDDMLSRQGFSRKEHLDNMEDLPRLPISAWPQLYASANMIVALPYETIEVIFNGTQLWGNLANHHPSCIFFDMEDDPRSWKALMNEDLQFKLQEGRAIALPVGPSISKQTASTLESNIENELKESVRLMRLRSGQESLFEDDGVLRQSLESYLRHLEDECLLDSDHCYDQVDELQKPWGAPTPFNSPAYQAHCRGQWKKHWASKTALNDRRQYLPVKANHVLSGIPLHLSTSDQKEIRRCILGCKPISEYFNFPSDEIIIFVCVKVFPLPSSVNSVWIFLGAELPLPMDRIIELAKIQAAASEDGRAAGQGRATRGPNARQVQDAQNAKKNNLDTE